MSSKPRILIVEDDASVRDLIRVRLSADYDPHTARNGLEALGRIAQLRPSAIILDINMPEMDGFRVLETLKTLEQGSPRIPVLVLTARHAAEDVRRAIGLGAKDYLTKPFNETQLLARVSRLLRPPIVRPPLVQPPAQDRTVLI